MTRLILDYYRRWGLVLAIGAGLQLILGWFITVEPKTPIEFSAMVLPICLGEILVLFDLSRGVFRILGTLPLTSGQIGRSWWLATVLVPAVILAALLFFGAGAAVFYHPGLAFPLNRLSLASLLAVLWLGTLFVLFFPATGKFNNQWQRLSTFFVALLTVFLVLWMVIRSISSFFGFFFSQAAAKNPVKLAILLAGGAFLTFVGWFRARRFDLARGRFGLPNTELSTKFYAYNARVAGFRLTPLSTAPHQLPEGYGGILFLLRTTFINGFLICLAVAIFWALILANAPGLLAPQDLINLRQGFETIDPTISFLAILVIFQGRPLLTHLRFLRTLPISAAKLAAVIIALGILPFVAASTLIAGVAGLSIGTPAALTILKGCILVLAPTALWIFFAVWRGDGIQAYALLMVTMLGWVLAIQPRHNVSFPLAGVIAVAGIMLAWLLTYYALLRGSRAYRVQTNPLGWFTRSAGR